MYMLSCLRYVCPTCTVIYPYLEYIRFAFHLLPQSISVGGARRRLLTHHRCRCLIYVHGFTRSLAARLKACHNLCAGHCVAATESPKRDSIERDAWCILHKRQLLDELHCLCRSKGEGKCILSSNPCSHLASEFLSSYQQCSHFDSMQGLQGLTALQHPYLPGRLDLYPEEGICQPRGFHTEDPAIRWVGGLQG